MRTRTLLASLLLAFVGLVALAPAASAQGEEGGEEQLSEDTLECIHLAEEADDPEACQESPNLILPATDELVWGSISFAVLLFLLYKYAYPPVKQSMEARTERIRAELQAADTAKAEAQGVLDEYRAQLNDAKAEAGRIIEEARQAADAIKRDQEVRLQSELAELRQRAVADIEAAKANAMSDLRGEVALLAIGAAETVVQHNLDSATQTQLVEDYINQVAAQRS
ncbi:MAG TPA: F0F1 ATP synthase subunit B [Acidimicrobiales bacterium]